MEIENIKVKKPIFKCWWFWLIIVLVVLGLNRTFSDPAKEYNTTDYLKVTIKELYDELETNPLNAKNKYEDKYIEFDGYVTSIDSNGKHIYVSKSLDFADKLATNNMLCYTVNKYRNKDNYDNQIAIISALIINDKVTIRGKVKSISESLGYSVDIVEIIKK